MQQIGPLSFLLYWSVVGYIVYPRWRGPAVPISEYVTSGNLKKLYQLASVISFTGYALFCIYWLFPEYDVHYSAAVLILFSYITQMLTTFTIRSERKSQFWHDWYARLSGTAAICLLPFLAASDSAPGYLVTITWVSFPLMIALGTYLRRVNRTYFMPLQIGLFLYYHLLIIGFTYL